MSPVSSPISTGGEGTYFEQHVGAYWLALLLVRGVPPIMLDTLVAEVHFQTERLGWHTDDFLVVCGREGAAPRNFVGQVKLGLTVSATDATCRDVIGDFWRDFNEPARFSPADDRLVLVIPRGTETLLRHFAGLLDCARAARNEAEFERRMATAGFVSAKTIHYCDEIRKIVGALEGEEVTAAGIWPFLRVLHVLTLDLHTSTRQSEAQIRSLLAYTVDGNNSAAVAEATWNALLTLADAAIPAAQSFCHPDLPSPLREIHGSVAGSAQHALRALEAHTELIVEGVRSTIGPGLHLPRPLLVQQVLDALAGHQVVLVTGAAGSGKSVVAKDAISVVTEDHFAFAFRAEEFAVPHFDATLAAAQVPVNSVALRGILGAQPRTVILVESIERLLERSTRDAFSDLMTLVSRDRSVRVVLTSRDYSADQVRSSFLDSVGVAHATIVVPALDDAELALVEAEFPALAQPLANPALRDVLRNPYFLDKALAISWSSERSVPESEREFRSLFWRQVIRADIPVGIGRLREEVFQRVAIRRAKALSPYVLCNDLDPMVVGALRSDSLLESSGDNPSFVATAHDVLEDWAILQWLEEQHRAGDGSITHLASTVGTHPAIRRAYRKWVAELVERDPSAADRLFRAAVTDAELSAHFRDDTLVALLRAPSSPQFLARHERQLLADDRTLIRRVIHLLRVACVTAPPWLPGALGHGSIFNVPDGSSWAPIVETVGRNLEQFTERERPLLLGLIEDAVRPVTWQAPRLPGETAVAAIAHWLLAGGPEYGPNEERDRVLRVIAKIPLADPDRFSAILRGTRREHGSRDRACEGLRKLVFAGTDGMPAARDLPELVVEAALEYLLMTDEEARRSGRSRSGMGIDVYFGVHDGLSHDHFPSSALRGPWLPLLRHHPDIGLDLYGEVFNRSADWYAHPRAPDPLEPAWEAELTFADGSTHKQWANPRLWNLYRGISVGPYVLQSLLMASEKWLLEYAAQHPSQLDLVLLDILRRSESASVAAVVASVATAHPHASGEALLVLLTARDYIELDRGRYAAEHSAASLAGFLPSFSADARVFHAERKQSSALAHRKQDLEAAVANLQLGPLAARVHSVLDGHIAALPPKDEQSDRDRVWRLALHRMDLRQYTFSDVSRPGGQPAESGVSSDASPVRQVQLELKEPEPDVQALIDETAAYMRDLNARLAVYLWGTEAFEQSNRRSDPGDWRGKLTEAQTIDREVPYPDGSQTGPALVAAVCVRDHWEQMQVDEQEWCIEVICSEVLRFIESGAPDDASRWSMTGDRPSAAALPRLLHQTLAGVQMARVREAFATALTHPEHEVREHLASGIDERFWQVDPDVAMRCVNAIAMEAHLTDEARIAERSLPFDLRTPREAVIIDFAADVRKGFWKEGTIPGDALDTSTSRASTRRTRGPASLRCWEEHRMSPS